MNYGSKVKEFYDQLIDEMRENYERKKKIGKFNTITGNPGIEIESEIEHDVFGTEFERAKTTFLR